MLGDDGLAMKRKLLRAGLLLFADLRCQRYSAGQDDRWELMNILTLQAKRHRHRYRIEAAFSPAGSRIWEMGPPLALLPALWLFLLIILSHHPEARN